MWKFSLFLGQILHHELFLRTTPPVALFFCPGFWPVWIIICNPKTTLKRAVLQTQLKVKNILSMAVRSNKRSAVKVNSWRLSERLQHIRIMAVIIQWRWWIACYCWTTQKYVPSAWADLPLFQSLPKTIEAEKSCEMRPILLAAVNRVIKSRGWYLYIYPSLIPLLNPQTSQQLPQSLLLVKTFWSQFAKLFSLHRINK